MINRKLIEARKAKGWTQTYLASQLAVSSITVSRWENGSQAPQPYCVQRLCQLFGLTDKECRRRWRASPLRPTRGLGFAFSQTPMPQEGCMVYKEMEKYFTFGNIKTTELILDGDGTSVYLPQHIHAHYIPMPLELPAELQAAKERIAQEQEERKIRGDAYQWNGERYNLVKFNLGRDPANEDMTLGLWFRPSDYYTFLATSTSLQDPKLRAKYLAGVEWDEAVPLLAHSFSVLLTLVTSDGHTILVQRGKSMGCRPNAFDVSLAEGLSRPVDRDATSQAPDVYRCALRGLSEELGLQAPADFSPSDILFLSFAVDTEFCMWGVFGMVKIHRRAEDVLENLQRGVRDRFESRKVFSVPFTPEEVGAFVFSHEPFSPGGLVCLYHALVHEFGKEQVNKVIASF